MGRKKKKASRIKISVDVVSLQEEGHHLFVECSWSGNPLRMLIDTGASVTVLDKQVVTRISPDAELQPGDRLATSASSSDVKNEFTVLKDFRIGDFRLKEMLVAVMDLHHVNSTYASLSLPGIHGVIGCNFLVQHDATLNLKKKLLRLSKAK